MRCAWLCVLLAACGSDDPLIHEDARLASPPDATPIADAAPPAADAGETDAAPPAAPSRTVTSVAGFTHHDGPLETAWLGVPLGLITMPNGDLLVFDGGYNTIRRIDAAGVLTTEVGSWVKGYDGRDDVPAHEAKLANVYGSELVLGLDEMVYFSDFANHRIRVWNPTGATVTACGGASVAPGHVVRIAGTGDTGFLGEGTSALDAHMEYPRGIAFWQGDLVFADVHNDRVRKIACATGLISTVAGSGDYGQVEEDGTITVFHADGSDPGMAVDFGDGGPATEAIIDSPGGVAQAPDGSLLITEWAWSNALGDAYGRVRRVDAQGVVTTVVGTRTTNRGDADVATEAGISPNIRGIVFDADGTMYLAGPWGDIRRVEAGFGKVTTVLGDYTFDTYGYSSADVGHPAIQGHVASPCSLAWRDGRLYYSDGSNGWIRYLEGGADGIGPDSLIGDVGTYGGGRLPYAMGVDNAGQIIIAPNGEGRLLVVDRATGDYGTLLNRANVMAAGTPGLEAGATHAQQMNGVAFDEDNNLYYVEFASGQLMRIAAQGGRATATSRVAKIADMPVIIADSIAVGGGVAYVSEPDSGEVYQVAVDTGVVTKLVGTEARDGTGAGLPLAMASPIFPLGMALDVEHQLLYVADPGVGGVWRLDLTGGMTQLIEVVQAYDDCPDCKAPQHLALHGGFLFVGERDFGRVLRIDLDDPTRQVALVGPSADGLPGFVADEVPSTAADLEIAALGVGPDGLLYIAEYQANRVRRVGGVDIAPGEKVNRIHLSQATPVRVVLLSSYAFDALDIVHTSVSVAGARPVAGGTTHEDMDGDGRMDLVVSVRPTEMTYARAGQKELTVEATTISGRKIVEADYVVVTPD